MAARLEAPSKPETTRPLAKLVERQAIDREIRNVRLVRVRHADIPHVPGEVVGSDAARGDRQLVEVGGERASRERLVARELKRDAERLRRKSLAVLRLHAASRFEDELAPEHVAIGKLSRQRRIFLATPDLEAPLH